MPRIGTSQNGYPVYDETSHYVRSTAAGRGWWSADRNVATVLDAWCEWFDANIEPVVRRGEQYDDWSWAVRPIVGQSSGYSNHASATARDINATQHPYGVRNTYSSSQRTRLRNGLRQAQFCNNSGKPVIRAGEFYSSTVDGMHFEINASPRSVAQAAAKIREQEDDVKLTDKVELSAAAARNLNSAGNNFREGDEVSVAYLLLWGDIRSQQANKTIEELEDRVAALEAALQGRAAEA